MSDKIVSIFDIMPGDTAKFVHPQGGYDGDIKEAAKHLTEGESYKVAKTEIHPWVTYVWLEGTDNVSFNSCLFDFYTG